MSAIKFLIDENVPIQICEILSRRGYEFKRTKSGLKNSEILKLALLEDRIIVTGDRDFIFCVRKDVDRKVRRLVIICHPLNWIKAISFIDKNLSKILELFKYDTVIIIKEHGITINVPHGIIMEF